MLKASEARLKTSEALFNRYFKASIRDTADAGGRSVTCDLAGLSTSEISEIFVNLDLGYDLHFIKENEYVEICW